jgi:hypothetical protein
MRPLAERLRLASELARRFNSRTLGRELFLRVTILLYDISRELSIENELFSKLLMRFLLRNNCYNCIDLRFEVTDMLLRDKLATIRLWKVII